jgi:hypothetical protein
VRRLALLAALAVAAHHAAADDARTAGLKRLESTRDLKAAHNAMQTVATIADADTIDKLFRFVRKESRRQPVYGLQLEDVLRFARNAEARRRVAARGLRSRSIHVRRATAIALGAWKFHDARKDLVEVADAELHRGARRDPALLYEAAHALGRIGGEGVTEILFRCAKDEDWRARLVAAELKTTPDLARDRHPLVRQAYTGKAASGSTVFVVETAGQLAERSMDMLRLHAETAILTLADGVPFNVLTFSGLASSWQRDGPVAASADERHAATVWLKKQALPRGNCNLWGALERALEDESVREIRLYASGIANTGKYEQPEEIAMYLHDLNRFRRVKIHVFSVAFSGLLQTIAHDTGGEFRSWDR